MRTTLAIDDVLAAVKALAAQQHKSVGEVISALARQALRPKVPRMPGLQRRGNAPRQSEDPRGLTQ